MWDSVVRVILRRRIVILVVIAVITAVMIWQATQVTLSYEMAQMLPAKDVAFKEYAAFKEVFGEEGNVMFIGLEDERIFQLDYFNELFILTEELRAIPDVTEMINLTNMPMLVRDDEQRQFVFRQVFDHKPADQATLDSLVALSFNQPFFDKLLFNSETGALLMAITIDWEILHTTQRIIPIQTVEKLGEAFTDRTGIVLHYSGLPFIRTKIALKIENELKLFVFLAMIVASVALFLFFRSLKAMVIPIIIVVIGVVWALGTLNLLGYEITVLTGIIPPLIIIIGVENCIFLLNKYHYEYRSHGNKIKSLARVVQRVGNATMLTNATTAVGFATFIITGNRMLVEFGIVAALNILSVFLLTITLTPIFFSFLSPPDRSHIKHLDSQRMRRLLERVVHIISHHRGKVYVVAVVLFIIGVAGISRLHTTGSIIDDIPHRDKLYSDLRFFERQVSGIMPFEIMVDTQRPNGVMRPATLQAIDGLQEELAGFPELSKPLSIAEAMKLARQAFYRGDPDMYDLPHRHDRTFIQSYLPREDIGEENLLRSLVDSTRQRTRISLQVANIGTPDIIRIMEELQPSIDSLFDPESHQVIMTGSSVVYLKGTEYLINNLLTSLVVAVIVISILMALLFSRARMVIISIIPNIFPQVLTAALMGYLGIPIKPSTILIFSIALGISVDNSIHFLAKFRQELRIRRYNIRNSVLAAIRESGTSMIYTFVVLFFGFIIFTFSSFGGTQALGYLIAFTLSVALMSNLFLLPSILLSLHKRITGTRLEKSWLGNGITSG